jgi:hypothetical protein
MAEDIFGTQTTTVTAIGIQGISGAGSDGATGPAGATGPSGGVAGATGATGINGATGAQGQTGATGMQGIRGASGATGSIGATGESGSQGIRGASGVQGASGVGATGIDGATGSQGIQGASGATGVQGASGVGATGISGSTGIQGASGATGIQGASGVGATGLTGTTGATGSQGAQGASGATGISGADALWNFTGAYNAGSAYAVGDVATYNGETWYRINSNGGNVGDTPSEGTFWTLLAAYGETGLTGATGIAGATGVGVQPTIEFTTSSTNQVVIDTIDASLCRSAKYDMQISHSTSFQATELRLLVDEPNVYLTEYGIIGDYLGDFIAYYSPLSNEYTNGDLTDGAGVTYWSGTTLRVYTTNDNLKQALLAMPLNTDMVITTLNDGGPHTVHNNTVFTKLSEDVYQATLHQSKTPTALVSGISWTGTDTIELRFTPINAVTKLRYIKNQIAT